MMLVGGVGSKMWRWCWCRWHRTWRHYEGHGHQQSGCSIPWSVDWLFYHCIWWWEDSVVDILFLRREDIIFHYFILWVHSFIFRIHYFNYHSFIFRVHSFNLHNLFLKGVNGWGKAVIIIYNYIILIFFIIWNDWILHYLIVRKYIKNGSARSIVSIFIVIIEEIIIFG